MSFAASFGWAVLRAAVVAAAAVWAGRVTAGYLEGLGPRHRWAGWCAALLPLAMPAMVVGYAWSNFSLSLVRYPWWNEALYGVLLWSRSLPVATAVWWCSPPGAGGVSQQAAYCHQLARRGGRRATGRWPSRWRIWVGASGRPVATAWGLCFLLTLSDFELASLLGAPSWTVWLLDAKKVGEPLGALLRAAMWPGLCAGAVVVAVLLMLIRSGRLPAVTHERRVGLRAAGRWAARLLLIISVTHTAAIPLTIVLRQTVAGIGQLLHSPQNLRAIGWSILYGMATAAIVGGLAWWLTRPARNRQRGATRARLGGGLIACVPGLSGSLVVGLMVLGAFQWPALRWAYDTAAPLLFALTLITLPYGLLLALLVSAARDPMPGFVAEMGGRRGTSLAWRMAARPWVWVAVVLFYLGYMELTASAMLHPTRGVPICVLLYNQMHYGQSAVLSAMVCAAMAAPVAVALAAVGLWRAVWR